tara:strand:+ start:1822 stop:2415 length:594 start_codon:yes stop_codon:yes gene_type:complete
MTTLPKRIINDRTHVLSSILDDMNSMEANEFVKHLKDHIEDYKNMEMVNNKKKTIVCITPFKLTSVSPWTLFSSAYIEEHRGDETLTLERCGVLRKEAAVPWKGGKIDTKIYNAKAKEQNTKNYNLWKEYYKDVTITNTDVCAYLKSVDNINSMKRKELTHFCGLIEEIRNNDTVNKSTTIKELRKIIVEIFKKNDE